MEKFKKISSSFKLNSDLVNKIEISKSQKKILKILKYRRSNFKKCSKRLYFYNYYKKFYDTKKFFQNFDSTLRVSNKNFF